MCGGVCACECAPYCGLYINHILLYINHILISYLHKIIIKENHITLLK